MTNYFFQAGVDSLGAVELRNAVAEQFCIVLPATAIFDYPSSASLAQYVMSILPSKSTQKEDLGSRYQSLTMLEEPKKTTVSVSSCSCSFPGQTESMPPLSHFPYCLSWLLQSWIILGISCQHCKIAFD